MSIFNYKRINTSLIKPPEEWSEWDKVWISHYNNAVEAHSYEMRLRINYMEENKQLRAENEFLMSLVNQHEKNN